MTYVWHETNSSCIKLNLRQNCRDQEMSHPPASAIFKSYSMFCIESLCNTTYWKHRIKIIGLTTSRKTKLFIFVVRVFMITLNLRRDNSTCCQWIQKHSDKDEGFSFQLMLFILLKASNNWTWWTHINYYSSG